MLHRRFALSVLAIIGLLAVTMTPSSPAVGASHSDSPVIAFIAGNGRPPSGDRRFVNWLGREGYEVLIVDDDEATPDLIATSDADIAIVSSSVLPTTLDPAIAEVDLPMMILEGFVFDDFGLATRSGETTRMWTEIRLADEGSPLQGGLTFRPQVLTNPSKMNFGIPGGDAITVGREPRAPRNPVYFAYESGSELADGRTAAARRVAFPFPIYQPDFQNVNGGGRVLVQAALDWLLAETTIMDIQGGAHLSPRDGDDIVTQGVVTGVAFNGFYLQDPVGDGDPDTSDGIFVFGFGLGAAVGDMVMVSGSVSEFIPGGAPTGNLSTTQISADSVDVKSSGNPLPDPVIIGSSGVLPPNEIVISPSEEPTNLQTDPAVFNPDVDGIDFYESLEGMRVTVEDPVTTSATRTFSGFSSEFFTLPSDGAGVAPPDARTGRGGIMLQPDPDNRGDQNPERVQIQLDGTLFPDPVPAIPVGSHLSDVTGVVGYSFGNYEVNATDSFTWTPSGLTPEVSGIVGDDDTLTVASYNVLNLSADGSDTAQLATLGTQIVDHLNSPDVIALQEIQDNNGTTDDGTTDASETLQLLVDAIAAAGGPTYEAFDVAPADGASGGVPGGNIRNAFLYDPDRVGLTEFFSLNETTLALLGASDPTSFAGTRDPLVGVFDFNGNEVSVVNNHWTSRFGSTPVFGGPQPFVQAGETQRESHAATLNELMAIPLTQDPNANVIVTGDLNTFEWTNDLAEILPGVAPAKVLTILDPIDDATNDRYTFIFDGNSQSLDHAFVTDNLLGTAPVMDVVHVNNDFPRVDSTVGSDHEPLLMSFDLPAPPVPDTLTLQVLHASDLEGGVDALDRAPNFAAIVDAVEDANSDIDASVTLSAGDNYIPGPFFNAAGDRATFRDGGVFNDVYNDLFGLSTALGYGGLREGGGRADISIMNVIGFDASAIGNHEFDGGSDAMAGIIENDFRGPGLGDDRWVGAQFPYLSSNLDFTEDDALVGLFTDDLLPNTAFQSGPLQSASGLSGIPKIAPSTLVDLGGGQRLGVVGATTPLLEQISSPTGTTVIGPTDNDMAALADVIQPAIDGLAAVGVDKIVLVSHLQQLDREEELATLLEGVDIVIAGGSDTLLANDDDALRAGDVAEDQYPVITNEVNGDPVAIVSTDGEYSYVGRLVVEFDDEGILIAPDGSPLDDLDDLDLDRNGPIKTEEEDVEALWGSDDPFAEGTKGELVTRLVDAVEGVVIAKDGNVLGETDVFIEGRREFVRTEETNMGNLSADANLAAARGHDDTVVASIKNGGGIRAEIGEIVNIGNDTFFLPPQANPLSGKDEGQVSQLDVENSLRFNNGLTLLTLTAAEMQEVVEHAVAETAPGNTPGQFAQIGGMAFSYDPDEAVGSRVQTLSIVDDLGDATDVIVENGTLQGDADRTFRIVTLNFLAGGGDGYPFPSDAAADRVDLGDVLTDAGLFDFADPGSEQDAIAEFLGTNHPIGGTTPFDAAETAPADDERIQDLNVRDDTVPTGPAA